MTDDEMRAFVDTCSSTQFMTLLELVAEGMTSFYQTRFRWADGVIWDDVDTARMITVALAMSNTLKWWLKSQCH